MFVNKNWTNNHSFHSEEYECTRLGCEWDEYASDIDWGYYYNSTSDDDINKCQSRCSEDPSCGAFEWTKKYCSWWKVGKCQTVSDATISNTKFMMCRKPGILRYCNHLAFQFILYELIDNINMSIYNTDVLLRLQTTYCWIKLLARPLHQMPLQQQQLLLQQRHHHYQLWRLT